MLVYFGLLASNLIFMYLTTKIQNGKKLYFWLSVFQLTLIAGLRGVSVGTDTPAYVNIFENISKIDTFEGLIAVREEIGYVLINKAVALLGGNVNAVFTICAFVTSYGLLKFIDNNTDDLRLGVFLLITLMFFFTSMNVIRQYMATAIAINGLTYIKRKEYPKYLLTIFIAMFFHKLAILYLVFIVIDLASKYKPFEIFFYVLVIICVIFANQLINIIASIIGYDGYINRVDSMSGIMMTVVYGGILLFPFGSMLFNRKVYSENKKEIMVMVITFALSIVAMTSFYYANRIAWLFSPAALVLIPNTVKMYTKNDRKILYVFIGIMGILYFYYCLSINWQRIVPYIFCF